MITRERLNKSEYGRGLLKFLDRLVPYNVTDWGNDDSDSRDQNRVGDREQVATLDEANVVSSRLTHDSVGFETTRHALVIDIDHPSWLIPSTTPGHYHLYVDTPSGIKREDYDALLDALANAGVIEAGYAGASKARGYTSVRLPWVQKEKGWRQHD